MGDEMSISTVHRQPITDRSAWTGADMRADRSWDLTLDAAAGRQELAGALAQVNRRGLDLEAVVRYGIVRHGALGWTVGPRNAGAHQGRHPRTADGRPLVAGATR
jgi:hypothetical protein